MQIFLETERMVLRRFVASDLGSLIELDSDPEVMRFINGGLATPREVMQNKILPTFLHSYESVPGRGMFAAIRKADNMFLGWFGFRAKDSAHPDEVGLGYRLRRDAWGQGYATEGARALIRKGVTELEVQRVFATTYEYNRASRRVMEKAGLTFVRSYRLTAEDLQELDTAYHSETEEVWDGDDVEYALTKAEWEQTNPVSR